MRTPSLLLVFVLVLTACAEDTPDPIESVPPVQPTAETTNLPDPDSTTLRLFDEAMAQDLRTRSIGEVMQEIGRYFEGRPYLAGTLDLPNEEMLVCRLDGFDCVTFVETALAMARGVVEEDYTYDTFAERLLEQRYRDGTLDGYCSRLHYFSEWIADNDRRGNVQALTADLGGVPFEGPINFMTENRGSYPHIAENDSLYACIGEMEDAVNELDLVYIPQDRIASVYDRLQAGDIIGTATHLDGLDITHTGLVYDHGDGRKGFLHASTSGGVKVSPDLQSYVQNNGVQIGIVVARPASR